MKSEIDGYVEKYGNENHPPPWQLFTISNDPKAGNLHLVQKVFQGPFEVCCHKRSSGTGLKIGISSTLCTRQDQLLGPLLESVPDCILKLRLTHNSGRSDGRNQGCNRIVLRPFLEASYSEGTLRRVKIRGILPGYAFQSSRRDRLLLR